MPITRTDRCSRPFKSSVTRWSRPAGSTAFPPLSPRGNGCSPASVFSSFKNPVPLLERAFESCYLPCPAEFVSQIRRINIHVTRRQKGTDHRCRQQAQHCLG